jgi:hypothetical protein
MERLLSREMVVFLVLMPTVLAFANGWAQTNEGISFSRLQSVLYWLTGLLPCWWLNAALTRAGAQFAPLSRGPGFWLWAAAVPVIVFLGMGLVGFFSWRWSMFAHAFLGYVPLRLSPPIASADWFAWMLKGSVVPVVIWTAAILLQRQLFGRSLLQPAPAAAPTPADAAWPPAAGPSQPGAVPDSAATAPEFLRRLDRPFTGDLLAVQAQEHYIRVVGADHAPMLLYRFSDALEQLKSQRGLQVHRSWWVHLDAVDGIERDGTRMSLRLRNGERVPVSRRYMGVVEAAVDAVRR